MLLNEYQTTFSPHDHLNMFFTIFKNVRRVFKEQYVLPLHTRAVVAELTTMVQYSVGVDIIAVCYLVVVISSGGCTTIQVPSGPNSTLESYLCEGRSLPRGTSLLLEAGEHVINGGPFCSISHLQDLALTGAGRDLTVVRCNAGGRGFKFSFLENLTIAKLTFVGCGEYTEVSIPNNLSFDFDITLSPVVLYFESSSVTIQHITITSFSGFGVYGLEVHESIILNNVQFLNCASSCSGAAFVNSADFHVIQGNPKAILTVQGCLFSNLTNDDPKISSGLSI